MKKLTVYAAMMILGLCTAGCGRKETGSELLTDAQEAVTPVAEEEVIPAVQETELGTALHIYRGDEQAENIVRETVYVDEVNEQTVMEQLTKALGMSPEAGLKSISFGVHGGERVVILDLNRAFADYLNRLGTAGETIVMGSLTNTFLDCYQCELMLVTAEGMVLETGHTVYEEYLGMYPFVEASYRVTEKILEGEGIHISCPQIEGLGDARIEEEWNRFMLENEEQTLAGWEGQGTYEASYQIKTQTPDALSILMEGSVQGEGGTHTFKYTYNIDLNTGDSVRLKDHVDVEKLAENMFAGTGYYVEEALAPYFVERLDSIYESPDALARSLEGYDFEPGGGAPYGYSYLEDGKVWICMEVPHSLGDYIEIELDAQ